MAYTWLQFKTAVKALLSDGQRNDSVYTLAVAEYVKAKFAREANQDLPAHDSYVKSYVMQRVRLLGYVYAGTSDNLIAAVKTLVGVDATRNVTFLTAMVTHAREDLEGLGPMVDALINQSVMDIQSAVPLYRIGQQNTFQLADLTLSGFASVGSMPDGSQIRDGEFITKASGVSGVAITSQGSGYTTATATISGDGTGATATVVIANGKVIGIDMTAEGQNYTAATIAITGDGNGAAGTVVLGVNQVALRPFDWTNRDQLISGKAPINNGNYYLCIDPYGKQFYVFPHVDDAHKVVLTWDGLKANFADVDTTPFDEPVTKTVAEYVRGHLALDVVKDAAVYAACMKPVTGTYYMARKRLYLDAQDRTRMRNA